MGRKKEGMFYLIGLSLQDTGPESTVSVEAALQRGSAWRNKLWNGRKYWLLFIICNFQEWDLETEQAHSVAHRNFWLQRC